MWIQVKLGGPLKRYADSDGGTKAVHADDPLTVAETMARIGVEEDAGELLVIVNDDVVPPSEHGRFTLKDNDRLTLMPRLKGG
ncbi:MAG: hypothetical protein MAG794_00599 [Gammaproteobacteria bacterium]|nr:hypothetical protein [Gammaproteobacteria bacterium]